MWIASILTGLTALCNQNPSCKLFVSSIFGCSLKSTAAGRVPNLDPTWNVRAAFRGTSDDATPLTLSEGHQLQDARVSKLSFTYAEGSQWFPMNQQETTEDDFDSLLSAINATIVNDKHGSKPEVIIAPSPDGSRLLPFTSVNSIGECVALVKSHGQIYFTYLSESKTCLAHQFPNSNKSNVLNSKGESTPVDSTVSDTFQLKSLSATSEMDCTTQCKNTATCVASRYTTKCSLYAPAPARSQSVVAGWVTSNFNTNPVANLSKFSNHSKVHFYTTAHQDDHELFMSNTYHNSIDDSMAKVVFIYTTSGDDHSDDSWRQARELGTLAATIAWVDNLGKFESAPMSDVVALNGHKIVKITIGNVVHYFMRTAEYGADGGNGFMALMNDVKPVSPMDDPSNPYTSREEFKATLHAIYTAEAKGMNDIEFNAQDPHGEQPDHDMHLATGQLVWDIVNADTKWKTCAP